MKSKIKYYESMIKLNELDISRLEAEIYGKPLCHTLLQRNKIKSYNVCIDNLNRMINNFKNNLLG